MRAPPAPPVLFLVNIDAAHQRRARMTAQLAALGLAYERVGTDLRRAARAEVDATVAAMLPGLRFDHDALSGAEIGCWVSHLAAWRRMLEAGAPSCAVLEDDLLLDARLPDALRVLGGGAAGYDVVLFGTSSRTVSSRRRTPVGDFHVHAPVGTIYNTWGYVVARAFAERFFRRPPTPVGRPIDHLTGGALKALRPRTGVLRPAVVVEDPESGAASQIAPTTTRLDRARLVEAARRRLLAGRFGDLVGRLFHYL